MTVSHFTKDGKAPFCGTKARKNAPTLVDNKEDVTCKKCKKSMSTHNQGITFHESRKHGFYLQINRQSILKLGGNIDGKIGVMSMMKGDGALSTSIKFASNNLMQFTNMKTINYLKRVFNSMKESNGDYIRVSDVKDMFELEAV